MKRTYKLLFVAASILIPTGVFLYFNPTSLKVNPKSEMTNVKQYQRVDKIQNIVDVIVHDTTFRYHDSISINLGSVIENRINESIDIGMALNKNGVPVRLSTFGFSICEIISKFLSVINYLGIPERATANKNLIYNRRDGVLKYYLAVIHSLERKLSDGEVRLPNEITEKDFPFMLSKYSKIYYFTKKGNALSKLDNRFIKEAKKKKIPVVIDEY